MRLTASIKLAAAAAIVLVAAAPAAAKPPGPSVFCDTYPEALACQTSSITCQHCHLSPPQRNVFGSAVEAALPAGEPRPLSDGRFSELLPTALRAVEDGDADGDGFSNYDEFLEGTAPGDAQSFPAASSCNANTAYNLCDYDHNFAYKRVALDFCGQSPTFDEMEELRGMSEAEKDSAIGAKLVSCLNSPFWLGQDGVLWNLANRKIRPIGSLKSGPNAGSVPIADYDHDYNLFVWTQMDGHDAREAMTADYFVGRDSPTEFHILTPEEEAAFPIAERENIPPANRAGLITTRWFLLYFEMFAILPRAAAAQAVRAFLRQDWARMEGLYPVTSEPIDLDNAGVSADGCVQCHSTIDPAAQAFQDYSGFVGGPRASFVPDRMDQFENQFPGISQMGDGYIFGQQVPDLNTWAQVAADSDDFAKATVMDYWDILVGEDPSGDDIGAFTTLWEDFRSTDAYSIEAMLANFVRTRAYGEP